jgi:epoxyqueuosine reductase
MLPASAIRDAARACGFALVGLARAEALPAGPLDRWLASGHDADMVWVRRTRDNRLDPTRVLPGALTVIALAIPHTRPPDERSTVASYARGRDYHYAHRDRLKALRKRLLRVAPGIETYASVDTGAVMEKVWAQRAGLGWIGKNGCLITREHGSGVTLSVMYLDREVDAHDAPHADLCGDCALCLRACPTDAFPAPGVVDARRCIAYHTIENEGHAPDDVRPRLRGHLFGCDVCQEVCPFNHAGRPPGDDRLRPRALGLMPPSEVAALSPEDHARLAPGTALARAGYHGLRRNAILAMSAAEAARSRALLERLAGDASPIVADAARWRLQRLEPRG